MVTVAPFDEEMMNASAPWLYKHPICVSQYSVQNPLATEANATLKLSFVANAQEPEQQAQLVTEPDRVVIG